MHPCARAPTSLASGPTLPFLQTFTGTGSALDEGMNMYVLAGSFRCIHERDVGLNFNVLSHEYFLL